MKFTIPSSVFRLFKLAVQISHTQDDPEPKVYKKIFEYCRVPIEKLDPSQPVTSIKLYMELVQLINQLDKSKYYDEFTYVSIFLTNLTGNGR